MASIEKMLAYAKSMHHKVGYSMAYPARLGPDNLDCSSFVYYALIAGGFLPSSHTIGNTETLYKLNGSIFTEISHYDFIKPGDIFIRGIEGNSLGAKGHTGIFTRKGEIIHCNASNGTVTINNETSHIGYYLDLKRSQKERYFRPITEQVLTSYDKIGQAKVEAYTNVREAPNTQGPVVAVYKPGQIIYYDKIIETDNYSWISYIGQTSKQRRYAAYKDNKGNQWMTI